MSDPSPSQRASSDGPPRKRKRKTYSCLPCRRRKLKCDREQPCSRCQKEGHPQNCIFEAEDGGDFNGSEIEEPDTVTRRYAAPAPRRLPLPGPVYPPEHSDKTIGGSSEDHRESLSRLKRKVELLEARIATFESSSSDPQAAAPLVGSSPALFSGDETREQKQRLVKGKGVFAHFFGATNATSMLAHFPEIHVFIKDRAWLSTPIALMQKDLQEKRSRTKARKRQAARHVEENLFSLLPSQEVVDRLVKLYFDTYERTLRILHRPSFWTEYGNGDSRNWKEPFVAVVLLVSATVNCLSSVEPNLHDDTSTAREAAEQWTASAELWLSRQTQKHITLEIFQVHCLLLLAKRNNVIKRKRSWVASGNFLRIAISHSLHLEPSGFDLDQITVFEQEMRRRIWATAFEWDLEASIIRGVPPMASTIPSDCHAPLHINDEEIDRNSKEIPTGRPSNERTDTSFMTESLRSLPLRTSLTSVLNDTRVHMTFEEVLEYEARIYQELEKLPSWVKDSNTRTCNGLPNGFQALTFEGALLDIQLRQYLIHLHNPFTRRGSNTQRAYSRMAALMASEKILDYHFHLADTGNHALSFQGSGLLTSIITISLTMLLEAQNALMSRTLATSLHQNVNQALGLLEDKVLRLGEWYEIHWLATATFAMGSCQLDGKPEAARTNAVERCTKLYHKVMAFQSKQPPTLASPATQDTLLPSVSFMGPVPPALGTVGSSNYENSELPPLQDPGFQYDFAAINGLPDWDLDDLWGFDSINL